MAKSWAVSFPRTSSIATLSICATDMGLQETRKVFSVPESSAPVSCFPKIWAGILLNHEAIVWNRIALKYLTRHVNEVWCTVNYQADGLSAGGNGLPLSAARGSIRFDQEFLALPRRLPLSLRVRRTASLIRFAMHTKAPNVVKAPKPLVFLGFLPGVVLYLRDRYRNRAIKSPVAPRSIATVP